MSSSDQHILSNQNEIIKGKGAITYNVQTCILLFVLSTEEVSEDDAFISVLASFISNCVSWIAMWFLFV